MEKIIESPDKIKKLSIPTKSNLEIKITLKEKIKPVTNLKNY